MHELEITIFSMNNEHLASACKNAKALKTPQHQCLLTLNQTFLMSKNLGLGPLIPDKLSEREALTEFRHYGNGNSNSQ